MDEYLYAVILRFPNGRLSNGTPLRPDEPLAVGDHVPFGDATWKVVELRMDDNPPTAYFERVDP